MKSLQLKLLVIFLIVFSCTLFFNVEPTKAIYKEVKGTTISMSVLNPAVNYVATVEGIGSYETLVEAFAAVPKTGVKTKVTLLQNVTYADASDYVTVLNNQYVDFDLNGHTVTGSNDAPLFTINNGGKMEVGGSTNGGSINATGSKMAILVNGSGNNNEGTLYIKDGVTINSTGSAPAIGNKGNAYMTGGSITCSSKQAAVNTGTANDQNISTAEFIMTGGRITTSNAEKNQAIYNNGGSRVEISGDAYLYSQSSSASYLRATVHNNNGTLLITGGTIVSKNYAAVITGTGSTTIGTDDGTIDTTNPVLRGKTYGLQGTTAYIYDGIFESETNTRAIDVTNITKPNINFYDTTVTEGNNTYYATYLYNASFTVTFYKHSGDQTPYATETVANGGTVGANMPSNPTDNNYIFEGWEYDNGTSLIPFSSSTTIYGDIDVIGSWTPNIRLATIPSTFKVGVGADKTIPVSGPSGMESYTFSSADATIATVNSTTGLVHGVATGIVNITVLGSRSNIPRTVQVTVGALTHDVHFYDDDGETELYQPVTVADGGTVGGDMPSNPTLAGYVFDGWIYNNGNSLTPFSSSTEIHDDIDAIAVWKEPISSATISSSITIRLGNTETITFEPTGTKAVENFTLVSSDLNTVSVNGHTISGEALGSATITITGSTSGASRTITVNVTDKYSVVFKNDDNTILETILVSNGVSIDNTSGATLPTDPTKSGYIFDDWYIFDGTDVTTTRLDTSVAVTSDLIYKPRWAGANDVAANGTTYYTTYKAALDAVPLTGVQTEIRLLQDAATSGFSSTSNRGKILPDQNVLLNGKNHTLTCSGGNTIWNAGVMTLKNVTVTCGTAKTAPIDNGNVLTIIDSTITMTLSGGDGRAAVYNGYYSETGRPTTYGSVTIMGNSLLTTEAKDRSAVQNAQAGTAIDIQGGEIKQLASNATKYAVEVISGTTGSISGGTITAANNVAVSNNGGTLTITGGTITAENNNGVYNTGTLTIGTQNSTYDVTNPIIQGETYGVSSTVNYSLYDGIIKGKNNNRAVNDFTKITGTEDGYVQTPGTEGDYYTLYYSPSN